MNHCNGIGGSDTQQNGGGKGTLEVTVFPFCNVIVAERRQINPVEFAKPEGAQNCQKQITGNQDQEHGIAGIQVNNAISEQMNEHARKQGFTVPEKGFDKRQVNVGRRGLHTCCNHCCVLAKSSSHISVKF